MQDCGGGSIENVYKIIKSIDHFDDRHYLFASLNFFPHIFEEILNIIDSFVFPKQLIKSDVFDM